MSIANCNVFMDIPAQHFFYVNMLHAIVTAMMASSVVMPRPLYGESRPSPADGSYLFFARVLFNFLSLILLTRIKPRFVTYVHNTATLQRAIHSCQLLPAPLSLS